ncbi:MAG: serine/threonine protein kinase [Candidatus Eisenbacteria bacterium]|nr:serine/threonine protein kinase [Candidatus Eisenbacteria bacterium]
MGEVWLAQQIEPVRRRVAIKVVRAGLDTSQIVDRFESERQALAMMDHPAIATVFDGGTAPDGRPFFAMEYVKGEPITTYCDRHRLGTRERLRLFIGVCEGVQHAHQKGIIHRDLKPSNVLISIRDDGPAPKIIDFGVAKAMSQPLSERNLVTEFGVLVGTPEYMSPEQAEMGGLDVDTRTDVYALGVLLYELLTGVLPFDSQELRRGGYAEIQRLIREQEPSRPSTRLTGRDTDASIVARNRQMEPRRLVQQLRGDLDWITMRALEKDRTRRYPTANGLAADIERYLRDEPVTAGPPSGLYRARKLFRRHRIAVLAGAAVSLALVAGVIGTSWGLLRAREQAREARRQAAIAEAVNEFLNVDLLAAAVPSTRKGQGKDVTVREVLAAAAERLDRDSNTDGRFAKEPLVEASIRTAIGRTYRKLGEYQAAEPHLRRALALRGNALGPDHPQTWWAMHELGLLEYDMSRLAQAESLLVGVYERSRLHLGPEDADVLSVEMQVANLYRKQGRFKEAEPIYVHNLDARRRSHGDESASTLDAAVALANLYQETGRYEQAEPLHRQVMETYRRTIGERDLATVTATTNLANDLALLGRFEDAEPLMKLVLDQKVELYGPDHPTTLNSVSNLGELNGLLGRDAEAEAYHRQALAARTRVLGALHARTLQSQKCLAVSLVSQRRFAEAEPLAAAGVQNGTQALGERDLDVLSLRDARALALIGLQRAGEAEKLLRSALNVLEDRKAKGEDSGEGEGLANLVRVHLGMALAGQHRWPEAESLLVTGVPQLPQREAETRRAIRFVVDFYDAWNRAEPDPTRAARAEEWRRRPESAQAASASR